MKQKKKLLKFKIFNIKIMKKELMIQILKIMYIIKVY